VIITGCNTWNRGMDVVVGGTAVQVTDDTVLERIARMFDTKWDGRWQFTGKGGCFRSRAGETGEAMVFSVTPTKIFAHSKGDPFGATTHRF
jgi:hypothetical protein